MTLEEARANIGAGVVYQPYPMAHSEEGTIVRVTDRFAFVRYSGEFSPKATAVESLTLLAEEG